MRRKKEMEGVKGSVSMIFSVLLLLILVFLLMILVYFFYISLPGEPEEGDVIVEDVPEFQPVISKAKQFYPNTKFNHNSLSFHIDPNCDEKKKSRIIQAFNIVKEDVGIIDFYELGDVDSISDKDNGNSGSRTQRAPDIEVSCSENVEDVDSDYFIAGEGGAKEIIQTGKYNVITNGIILLYDNKNSKTANCVYPSVELHELMHVFGFDHLDDENSIMYPYLESCKQRLDQHLIDELKILYSEENLPDLYFEKVSAVKYKCKLWTCLDFNITIKNSGTVDADNVKFSVLEDGELLETKEASENVEFGGGIIVEIRNLKLKDRDSKEISFIIDYYDLIREIDEGNNGARVGF